ncbi:MULTISPECIES: hypothetical protein [Sorangium]|uniref:Roadblock/LAMTOR2 domain-containing protein n=1 Tax=Sorangium atrum TaxID=2995308 RepID=A0ABT5BX65_9BACT|nr:hypothetical protein [Sorangium aterium]MDC0678119.1 hypothetical protein [Sorangium aterium]
MSLSLSNQQLVPQPVSDGCAGAQRGGRPGGRAERPVDPGAPSIEQGTSALDEGIPTSERRRRRSDDPVTALHYQLSTTRAEANLDVVVLVDDSGCLVAGAGAWPACEELAAYAPLLANPDAVQSAAVGSRIATLTAEVEVQSLSVEGGEVLLCGRGGTSERGVSIARAAAGCLRILRAAA